MSTSKAVKQPPPTNDRTSEVQMNLAYAQRVAATVKARRLAELNRQMVELKALPVTHPVDLALRDDLLEHCRAEIKALDDE